MASKNVMLQDSNLDILDPQTVLSQVKDANGDTVLSANPTTKKVSGVNSYKIDADALISYPTLSDFPAIGEDGKLYLAQDTNYMYRWSTSSYVQIGGGQAPVTSVNSKTGAVVLEISDIINAQHKLSSDLVDDTEKTNKFVTASEKAQITTNQQVIAGIKDGVSIDSFADVETALSSKQPLLVNQQNIKSVNGQSLLGSGDLEISGVGVIELSTETGTLTQEQAVAFEKDVSVIKYDRMVFYKKNLRNDNPIYYYAQAKKYLKIKVNYMMMGYVEGKAYYCVKQNSSVIITPTSQNPSERFTELLNQGYEISIAIPNPNIPGSWTYNPEAVYYSFIEPRIGINTTTLAYSYTENVYCDIYDKSLLDYFLDPSKKIIELPDNVSTGTLDDIDTKELPTKIIIRSRLAYSYIGNKVVALDNPIIGSEDETTWVDGFTYCASKTLPVAQSNPDFETFTSQYDFILHSYQGYHIRTYTTEATTYIYQNVNYNGTSSLYDVSNIEIIINNLAWSYKSGVNIQPKLVSGTNIKTINNTSIMGSGDISVGTYVKPSDGIPKADLANGVQSSLNRADSAVLSVNSTLPDSNGNVEISSSSGIEILDSKSFDPVPQGWGGFPAIDGDCVWTDGENIYWSAMNYQYVLNKETSVWTIKEWTGLTSFYGNQIWTDGTDIYYSSASTQRVLNKATSEWESKTWTGLTNFYGSNVWTDGTDIYYSSSTTQYVLNKATSGWTTKTWTGLTDFTGANVWTDGTDIYYSYNSSQYVLNKATSEWTTKTWTGLTSFDGRQIWTNGTDIYYSYGNNDIQKVLDKSTSTWNSKTWLGITAYTLDAMYIWTDGENYYFSTSSYQKVFNFNDSTLSNKIWVGPSSFEGNLIWTDGTNIYYSKGDGVSSSTSPQKVLDRSTSIWNDKTWTGVDSRYLNGNNVWTDGTDIYYSYTSTQYVLNKATSEWESKTWTGLTNFTGANVWTDGTDIYYSSSTTQYVLNKATSGWTTKTWAGLVSFTGSYVWTDGTDIYYSYNSSQYVLNKATSEWTTKTWTGLTSFLGSYVWTDGIDFYYSSSSTQYILNKATSEWTAKTWTGLTSFSGNKIWKDGNSIYLSDGMKQYLFDETAITHTVEYLQIDSSYNPSSDGLVTGKAVAQAIEEAITTALGGNY